MPQLYFPARLLGWLTSSTSQPRYPRLQRQYLALLLALVSATTVLAQTTAFRYVGDTEIYTVPTGVTRLQVVATGAAGGRFDASTAYSPGAQVVATLSVSPGEVLFVVVGGQGSSGGFTNAGGYNGGGSGGGNAGGGGGATELRRAPAAFTTDDYLRSRNAILVAGGGGGSDGGGAVGGVGGTPTGGDGVANNVGIAGGGATQAAAGGTGSLAGANNQGGTGNSGGGGGGGYYGGGGGAPTMGSAGGGGGSSWVTTEGSIAIDYRQGPTGGGDGALTLTPVVDPLPVHLVDFTAQAQGTAVALAWHTASEANSDHFAVERSRDGITFTTLGTVATHGTTTQAHAYDYRDALLPPGARFLYYRLRLVDQDGTATYSPVRTVAVAPAGLALFPNPTAASATLSGAAPGTPVHVLDALGRLVFATSTDAAGMASLLLPTTLPKGVYLVRAGQQAARLTVE